MCSETGPRCNNDAASTEQRDEKPVTQAQTESREAQDIEKPDTTREQMETYTEPHAQTVRSEAQDIEKPDTNSETGSKTEPVASDKPINVVQKLQCPKEVNPQVALDSSSRPAVRPPNRGSGDDDVF